MAQFFNPSPYVGSRFPPRQRHRPSVDRLEDKPVHRLRITFSVSRVQFFPQSARFLFANGGFRRDHFGDPRDTFSRPGPTRPPIKIGDRVRRPKGVRRWENGALDQLWAPVDHTFRGTTSSLPPAPRVGGGRGPVSDPAGGRTGRRATGRHARFRRGHGESGPFGETGGEWAVDRRRPCQDNRFGQPRGGNAASWVVGARHAARTGGSSDPETSGC